MADGFEVVVDGSIGRSLRALAAETFVPEPVRLPSLALTRFGVPMVDALNQAVTALEEAIAGVADHLVMTAEAQDLVERRHAETENEAADRLRTLTGQADRVGLG